MQRLITTLLAYAQCKRRRAWRDRRALLAWQDQRLRRFLARIVPRSRFYSRHYKGLELNNWRELPCIDKATMMANFDDLNIASIRQEDAFALALRAEHTRNFSSTLGDITVGLSSGTSGSRGLFLVSAEERAHWAGAVLARVLPGPLWQKNRVALFLRANSNLYETVGSGRLRFAFFDLLHPLPLHIARLEAFQPTILIAPPSMLCFLARAQQDGRLQIAPHRIVACAEVLDPLDERFLEGVFGQRVHQIYQCTEGFLAATCEHGTLHLNEDFVAIQKDYLDRRLRKFMPIVTDFSRTTQPILRYRLDDILTERQTPCPCGSALTAIESIEGRCDDLFYMRPRNDGNRLVPVFPDFIRRAIIASSRDIRCYMARQLTPDLVEIGLSVKPDAEVDTHASIARSLAMLSGRLGCERLHVGFTALRQPPPGERKLKRVQRCFTVHARDGHIVQPRRAA